MTENIYSIDFRVKILTVESIGSSYKVYGPVRRFTDALCNWFVQYAQENDFHEFEITTNADLLFHCTFKDYRTEEQNESRIKRLLNLEHQDLRTVLLGYIQDNHSIVKEYIVFCMPENITIRHPLSPTGGIPSLSPHDVHQ